MYVHVCMYIVHRKRGSSELDSADSVGVGRKEITVTLDSRFMTPIESRFQVTFHSFVSLLKKPFFLCNINALGITVEGACGRIEKNRN